MKVSYRWLKQYVDADWNPDLVAERLTMSGLEVESVDSIGSPLANVVTGKVLDVQRHPNADKLSLCRVDAGTGAELQIVCGAPNVAAGQHVPVALVGAVLDLPDRKNPGEFHRLEIRSAKIRGEKSEGMICAEDELGLTSALREGIMVLPDETPVGQPFEQYLHQRGVETNDSVIDVSITPNRPDATSHIGIARDVAALAHVPLTRPDVTIPEAGGEAAARVSVSIDSTDACSRFVGIIVDNVGVGPSPDWLARRLEAIGLRPRNNVVDVTNYVMYECGQPLHAYDLETLEDTTIKVRRADADSEFVTLDGKTRSVPAGTLMIRDGKRDIGIAGVMGGRNTEVSESTTSILIESAWFEPSAIRKAARLLALQTDASYRFERGVDPTGQAWAAARAAMLIAELSGGSIVSGMIDVQPNSFRASSATLRIDRVREILGVAVPRDEIRRLLSAIGFEIAELDETRFECTIPPFRPDIEREIDIIEEVARLFGYDNIPEPITTSIPNFTPTIRPAEAIRSNASSRLIGAGFRETVTNSILSGDDAEYFNGGVFSGRSRGGVVHTANAISADMSALRPSMLSSLLPVVSHNINHGQSQIRLFDIGSVFNTSNDGDVVISGYREFESLCLVAAGDWSDSSFDSPARPADYFDLKGSVDGLLSDLGLQARFETDSELPFCEYGQRVTVGDDVVGTIGKLDEPTCARSGIESAIFVAELDWTRIVAAAERVLERRYEPVSKFPIVERDIAVIVPDTVPAGTLLDIARTEGAPLLLDLGIFDVYTGKGIADGSKSIAISLRFGAARTLQDAEVDESIRTIISALQKRVGAVLRA